MKILIIGAWCIALTASTPVPEKIEKQAEIAPSDILRQAKEDRDSRQFPFLLTPFSFRDVFSDPFSSRPGVQRRQRPTEGAIGSAFGSPDFVNVPADGGEDTTGLESGVGAGTSGNPLDFVEKVFADMRKLQQDLLGALFTQQQPDQTEEDSVLTPPRRERPSRPTSVFDLLGGLPAINIFTPDRNGGGSYDKLPENYDNSTFREEEIDGARVQVNETIKKQSSPFGHSIFHFKVYQLKPDETAPPTEQTQETDPLTPVFPQDRSKPEVQIPLSPKPKQTIPQEGVRPVVLNEPKEERPVFKEDFGPIVRDKGHEEQIPIRPTADERLNEV